MMRPSSDPGGSAVGVGVAPGSSVGVGVGKRGSTVGEGVAVTGATDGVGEGVAGSGHRTARRGRRGAELPRAAAFATCAIDEDRVGHF